MGTLDSNNSIDTSSESVADFAFSEEQLRLAAQALDEGNDTVEVSQTLSSAESLAGDSLESTRGDSAAAKEDEQNSQSTDNAEHQGEQGEDSKPDSAQTEPKESNYAKAKKNAERFDRNWQKLQEQQAELAKQRAELAAREAALAQRANPTVTTQQQQPEVAPNRRAEDFEEAADEWEREGKFDLAELARKQAQALRSNPPAQVPQPQQFQQQQVQAPAQQASNGPGSPQFIATWNENLRSLEQDADFADLRNRDSALYKTTAAVLQEEPRLSYFPDGIRQAARIAKLRVEVGAVPELKTKVQAYEQELAKLRAATSPSRGAPNSRGQAKAFEELSMAEQEKELMRLAQEVDSA